MVPFFASGNIMVLIPNLLVCVINVSIIVSVFVAATLCFQFWQYYPSTDSQENDITSLDKDKQWIDFGGYEINRGEENKIQIYAQ